MSTNSNCQERLNFVAQGSGRTITTSSSKPQYPYPGICSWIQTQPQETEEPFLIYQDSHLLQKVIGGVSSWGVRVTKGQLNVGK